MAGRQLKVFQAQFGFFDSVVAVPSQAAALKAWGTHQNLFATGQAQPATDEAAIASALAHPGVPLRRAIGSQEPFAVHPTSLPKVPDAPPPADTGTLQGKAQPQSKPQPKPKPKPARKAPPDRTALTSAEAALHDLDDRRKQEEAAFRREQEALDNRRATAQQAYIEGRKAATAAVVAARAAYRKAGGTE